MFFSFFFQTRTTKKTMLGLGSDHFNFAPKTLLKPCMPFPNGLGELFTICENVPKWPVVQKPCTILECQ